MSDDYDENSALDDGAFFKQLQSDVEDEKSLKLLMDVYDTNDMWTGQATTLASKRQSSWSK